MPPHPKFDPVFGYYSSAAFNKPKAKLCPCVNPNCFNLPIHWNIAETFCDWQFKVEEHCVIEKYIRDTNHALRDPDIAIGSYKYMILLRCLSQLPRGKEQIYKLRESQLREARVRSTFDPNHSNKCNKEED